MACGQLNRARLLLEGRSPWAPGTPPTPPGLSLGSRGIAICRHLRRATAPLVLGIWGWATEAQGELWTARPPGPSQVRLPPPLCPQLWLLLSQILRALPAGLPARGSQTPCTPWPGAAPVQPSCLLARVGGPAADKMGSWAAAGVTALAPGGQLGSAPCQCHAGPAFPEPPQQGPHTHAGSAAPCVLFTTVWRLCCPR